MLQFYVTETVFRFCSQPFKIDDFHESIHLCNNAIQTKYKNGERSSNLPEENMWDNDTFINYLRQVGERERGSRADCGEIFSDRAARGLEQHRLSRDEKVSDRVSAGNTRFG